MAAMTTALTEFADNGNSRTSTLAGHTAIKPRLVIEKRQVPTGDKSNLTYQVDVIYATVDAEGLILSSKVAFSAQVRYPVQGAAADIDAALAVFRDIIAGDEFASSVSTQGWLSA